MTKDVLADFTSFFSSPKKYLQNLQESKLSIIKIFWSVLKLVSVATLSATTMVLISSYISSLFGFNQSDNNQVIDFLNSYPLYISFALVVILGPFFEEVCFRLFISKKKWPFLIGVTFLVYQVFNFGLTLAISINPSLDKNPIVGIFFLILLCFLVITFTASGFLVSKENVEEFVGKNFNIITWFVVIFFGLIHLGNYKNGLQFFYLAPLLVAPQLIAGSAMVFIRVKYNFWWAFASHALYNFILSLSLFIYAIFGVQDELKRIVNNLNSGKIELSSQLLSANLVLFGLYSTIFIIAVYTLGNFLFNKFKIIFEFN
jgi:hypothetical protein